MSAICACMLMAGWQQVKMRLRRSSSKGRFISSSIAQRARFVLIQQLAFVVAARLFPAGVVDELAASRGRDPGGGVVWYTLGLPAYDGGGKGVLHRFFSQVEGM